MVSIGGGDLLDLWERAGSLDPSGRLRLLAAAGDPGLAVGDVGASAIGRVNAALLRCCSAVSGRWLPATAPCPACDQAVEFSLDAATLLHLAEQTPLPTPLDADGWHVVWRPLTLDDLEVAAAGKTAAERESTLLARCAESVKDPDGTPSAPGELPSAVRAALVAALSAADPLAEVVAAVACPACGAGFHATVELERFAWVEVDAAARRLLLDVDCLARAYGWTEDDVLALSDRRRSAYLQTATGGLP